MISYLGRSRTQVHPLVPNAPYLYDGLQALTIDLGLPCCIDALRGSIYPHQLPIQRGGSRTIQCPL
jgi:hypothetical protein